ncbi:MAG: hypothetical protein GF329_05670 [Candidatus Lokiarchaeota archaeon]|nr:hypothetical protein [Candidatus Lokiarchaeota archaeon]
MKTNDLAKSCRKHLGSLRNNISVFCNQLKGGSSPEYDDEFNSVYSFTPTFFDKAKKPSHALMRTAFRVSFTDEDWIKLGKDIWVTRRTSDNFRLNFLVNSQNLPDLNEVEEKIDTLLDELDFQVILQGKNNIRYVIKKRIPKLIISTSDGGIYVYSYPSDSEDSLTLGYMDSLKNFGSEIAIVKFTKSSIDQYDDFANQGLELSNNLIQFDITNPIDKYLNFSVIQINPNHIHDVVTRNMLYLATKFLREVLRRNNLLDVPFKNRIDIYQEAFEKPVFGGISANQIIADIQYGNEIGIHPLINILFRELTSNLNPTTQVYLYNSYTASIVAADYHHSSIKNVDYPQIKEPYYDNLLFNQSKIIRVISTNSINAGVFRDSRTQNRIFIFPLKYKLQFRNFYRVSPPSINYHLVFIDSLDNIRTEKNRLLISIIKKIIPFCETIYLRPEIDSKGRRTTRTITINKMRIRLPDFSFLTREKRIELRKYVHENKDQLLADTILKMIELVSFCRENLELKYPD